MSRKNLWAPWRMEFMHSLTAEAGPTDGSAPTDADDRRCFLCECAAPDAPDAALAQQHVLHRSDHALLMMNRYPYVNGHLLVAPHDHVVDLTDLPPASRHAVSDLIDLGARALKQALNCQGYNVGFNVGRCAGAALPGHVHAHLVPRWHGDTNFMELLGGVKVIPQAIEDCHAALQQAVTEILNKPA